MTFFMREQAAAREGMMDDLESNLLFRFMGTHSPWWRLTADSNALHLAASESADVIQVVTLNDEQAERVRQLTVITSSISLSLPLYGTDVPVHLVGRKIAKQAWAGTISEWNDTPSVARDLAQGHWPERIHAVYEPQRSRSVQA